ncbi:GDP-mannose 4,6-dehydratase [archaeon]|jgi:GDP-4-dehydro-6-deoxy-D-mannose reductase|nr:GDP-mannose 4,6-dehydratase [archaeon]MBT4242146.1 GDP-mannose 4,6-dehydratase [archaeon]MBT4417834.1 GDP-mannose 4,6-dehydratase [archaeon]
MVKAWITGGGGFMGPHLAKYLLDKGYEVLSTYYRPTTDINGIDSRARVEECDVRDKEKVFRLMQEFMPDKVFHLAAQSYPTVSWDEPNYTAESNIIGTTNIFEAVKKFNPECKILNAGSSAEYGFVNPDEVPVKESHALNPLHPYGVSKVAQEMLAYQYYKNFNLKPITIRIFNTTGPRKVNDVCADFTKRLIEIEKGINNDKRLRVGNLKTRRAITDVRDLIRAFDLALDCGEIGKTYNVSGEKVYEIGDIILKLRELVDFDFELYEDPKLIRPTDEPIIFGDNYKFKCKTNWRQEIKLEKTLKDMLDYWRSVL